MEEQLDETAVLSLDDVTISTFRDTKAFKDEINDNLYGWGHFRPQILQKKFNTGLWFLFLVCSSNLVGGAVTNGMLKVSITSIERQFELSSADLGLIISMYDVAGLVTLLPISHLGGRGHKAKWIGYGLMIQGIAIFAFTLPNFIGPKYTYNLDTRNVFPMKKTTAMVIIEFISDGHHIHSYFCSLSFLVVLELPL